jgi:hypothetical protein
MEECGQTKVIKTKGTTEVSQLWNKVYQRAFNHVKTTSQVILAHPDYLKKSLRVTQMLPAIDLEQ